MTALSLERLVHPRRTTAPRARTFLTTGGTMVVQSIRAAREFDTVVSPDAQVRVLERFATRIAS